MRNGLFSDGHNENSYEIFADDIIRFADKQGLDKFDVLGHSMGGRTSQTIACKYPDRIDGCISLDAAPVKIGGPSFKETDLYKLLRAMVDLDEKQKTEGLSRKDGMALIKEMFKDNTSQSAILFKLMNRKSDVLEWTYDPSTFFKPDGDVFSFDIVNNRSDTEMIYHLAGVNGPETFEDFETYTKVFKNIKRENVIIMDDCGHYLHEEKPEETTSYILKFLKDIDSRMGT